MWWLSDAPNMCGVVLCDSGVCHISRRLDDLETSMNSQHLGAHQWAHGVVVSHPLSMREALVQSPVCPFVIAMARYRSPCLHRATENVLLDVLPVQVRDRCRLLAMSGGACFVSPRYQS